MVKECLRIIWTCQARITRDANPEMPLKFWVIENPDGYLKWFLGKPAFQYNPIEFGANYTKKTNLWGIFNEPKRAFWNATSKGSLTDIINPMTERDAVKRMDLRSIAPPEFTKAFFLANP